MAPIAEKLLQEALALPEDARVDLAEALLESVDPGPADEGADAAWSAEARRRLEEVRTGAVNPFRGRTPSGRSSTVRMIRRIVSLHPEAIAEGREARLWYRARSQAVEEWFPCPEGCHRGHPQGSGAMAARRGWLQVPPSRRISVSHDLLD